MMNRLRDLLIDGVLLAIPVGATAYLLYKVIGALRPLLAPAAHLLPQGHFLGIAGLDLAAVLLLILGLLALGAFARSAPGRQVEQKLEQLVLSKIPGYMVIRSIAADMASTERESGLRPALVSFDDSTVLGFIVEESEAGDLVTVFLPGAPAAASGSVVLMPRERVKPIDAATQSALRTMKQRGLGLQQLAPARHVATVSTRAS
jgi:uncharacterized membrane protein